MSAICFEWQVLSDPCHNHGSHWIISRNQQLAYGREPKPMGVASSSELLSMYDDNRVQSTLDIN